MTTESFQITGMTCEHCVHAVEKEIEQLPVEHFSVTIGNAVVEFDDRKITRERIAAAIHEAGYESV